MFLDLLELVRLATQDNIYVLVLVFLRNCVSNNIRGYDPCMPKDTDLMIYAFSLVYDT